MVVRLEAVWGGGGSPGRLLCPAVGLTASSDKGTWLYSQFCFFLACKCTPLSEPAESCNFSLALSPDPLLPPVTLAAVAHSSSVRRRGQRRPNSSQALLTMLETPPVTASLRHAGVGEEDKKAHWVVTSPGSWGQTSNLAGVCQHQPQAAANPVQAPWWVPCQGL